MHLRALPILFAAPLVLLGQEARETAEPNGAESVEKHYTVDTGTRIPLSMINSISTKTASEGDRVYLHTAFPVLTDGRIVIPQGSWVAGTVTQVKRPGRVSGRGELYLRFDWLALPNGVTRDFRARVGALDGRSTEELDKSEGKIRSETNKGGDAIRVGEAAAAGASVGAITGSIAGRPAMGAGVGSAAGAAAALVGVLVTRGPDAVLAPGTTLEMVLDRPLLFDEKELDNGQGARQPISTGPGPMPSRKSQSLPMPGRRFPM